MIDIINILDISGNVKYTTPINVGCVWRKELMKHDQILLKFSTAESIDFQLGDYIEVPMGRYELLDVVFPTFNQSTGGYDYNLTFDAYYWKWKNKIMFYERQNNKEASWSLTRTPEAHLDILISNLNELGYFYNDQPYAHHVGDAVDKSAKLVSYNNTSILDALNLIAETWDCEWWVINNQIYLGRCEYNGETDLIINQNVATMSRSESKENLATRIYAFGSTRNIPSNYRSSEGLVVEGVVQKRLMLPEGIPSVDARQGMHPDEVVESVIVFDDIYPRRIGTMSGVSVKEEADEVENIDGSTTLVPWSRCRFEDRELNFSKEYMLLGEELRIVFTSGELKGMDFAVIYNPEDTPGGNKTFEIVKNEDYGIPLPAKKMIPVDGNNYILYGFDALLVPDQLIGPAEEELLARTEEYLNRLKVDPSVYECRMNMIALNEDALNLSMGDQVNLVNPLYFETPRKSRIYGFEKHLDGSAVTYTVGYTSKYSRLTKLEGQIQEVVYNGNAYASGSGGGVYVVGQYDKTTPTDRNVFSTLRAAKEHLSRRKEDVAEGHITFEQGILVKSPLTTPQARSLLSTALDEEAEDLTVLSLGVVEETGIPEILSTALTEQTAPGGFEGGTLGNLDNVDASYDLLPNGKYAFEMRDGILYPVAAGDLVTENVMRLTFVSPGVATVAYGNPAIIAYHFVSTIDDEPTGNGNVIIKVGTKTVLATSIPQGENTFDAGPYLVAGHNTITVEVTDTYATTRKLTYNIQAVNMSISSTFDTGLPIISSTFSYRYTPVGAIEKTVHFVLDGEEETTYVTSVSNRQLTQSLPRKSHGSHTLEVYMTAVMEGVTVKSNSLFYDLLCIESGNTTPVIASSFRQTTAEQYATVVIPYTVYHPGVSETDVALMVDNVVVSQLRVDRTPQTWNYRIDKSGPVSLKIVCGEVEKVFNLQIESSSIDVEAETTDLELFLTSMGRSNSETNRDQWRFEGEGAAITAQLTDFNWNTNGWLPDEDGNVALKLNGDARVHIPIQPFARDIRQKGKTIEIEFSTHDVVDYESVIASCIQGGKGFRITAQSAYLSGDTTKVESKFKEEERVRISFVIEETAENRLIYTYINGINSGTVQYALNESFTQTDPQNIVLGSSDCALNIYNIRIYDNNLTQYQILDNYIADMDDTDKKIALYEKNQVYDEYGELTYDKICNQIPCMTIIGDLPAYKGDKKTVSVTYENRQEPAYSFLASGCQIDVQGTSSQYYPRKNYKTNFKKGFTMTESGEQVDKYKLTADMIGASVFCEKADFAESSGTHNTGIANLADEILKDMGLLTPPQQTDEKVRTTVCGFPIVIFHKATEEADPEFVGKYNFNTDKAAEETFGFSSDYPDCQCWEFCNNTSSRMLFRESEYTRTDSQGKPDWLNDFEARYPDDDDLNEQYENGKIPVQLKRVTDWIVSCIGNVEKFRTECIQYFDVDFLVFYYMFTELLGMVDQRAKNMFITTWDGRIWYFILYDNDTCLGINNEGEIVFNYNIETHDVLGTQNVWNGADSELWTLVEQAFAPEIAAMYTDIRQRNILTYDRIYDYLNTHQSEKWCESIFNEDGKFKYIDPMTKGYYDYGQGGYIYTGEYLYALQGSRAEHRKWWLFNRFRYMDSKYNAGQYFGDTATLRLYTPANWEGIAPNADFTLTPYADQYLRVKFGSYVSSPVRGNKGVSCVMPAPENTQFNDTETIIYGASRLKSVGDLSAKYPGTVDMSSATKLEELIIGSSVEGYRNTNLRNVTVKSNKLLRRINIENCPSYTSTLDLSGCESIQEVYAGGSGITSVTLPSGGTLTVLELPETITVLDIRNQLKLNEGFELAGVGNLQKLILENVNIDVFALLARCLSVSPFVLERVRLINVKGNIYDSDSLIFLAGMGGIDINGLDIPTAVMTGTCNLTVMYHLDLPILQNIFKELTFSYKYLCVRFEDPAVKELCIARWDTNKNGEIDLNEAELQRTMGTGMFNGKQITSFNEFQYFKNTALGGENTFSYSTIKSVVLPLSAAESRLGGQFRHCLNLECVGLPEGITTIYGSYFYGCISLKNITFPNSLISVAQEAFFASGLEELYFPDSVETIGRYSFSDNLSLKQIELGTGVTLLDERCFRGAGSLEKMIVRAVIPPQLNYEALHETNEAPIYVPDESVNIYKAATNWKSHASRIFPLSQLK